MIIWWVEGNQNDDADYYQSRRVVKMKMIMTIWMMMKIIMTIKMIMMNIWIMMKIIMMPWARPWGESTVPSDPSGHVELGFSMPWKKQDNGHHLMNLYSH